MHKSKHQEKNLKATWWNEKNRYTEEQRWDIQYDMFRYYQKGENNLPIQDSVSSENIFPKWRWHKISPNKTWDDSLLVALIMTNVKGICSGRGDVVAPVNLDLYQEKRETYLVKMQADLRLIILVFNYFKE